MDGVPYGVDGQRKSVVRYSKLDQSSRNLGGESMILRGVVRGIDSGIRVFDSSSPPGGGDTGSFVTCCMYSSLIDAFVMMVSSRMVFACTLTLE